MPRILTLRHKDMEIPVTLKIFSRETLYGKRTVEKRGDDEKAYDNALLTKDVAHILPNKAISSQYVDSKGNYVANTLLVNEEGEAIPITRSMFNEPVELTEAISLEKYFNFQIERTYILNSEKEDSPQKLQNFSF